MRIIFFILVALIGLSLSTVPFIIAAFIYGFVYGVEELMFVGIFLDLLFGQSVPWLPIPLVYTCSLLGMLILFSGLKPLLFFHERILQ